MLLHLFFSTYYIYAHFFAWSNFNGIMFLILINIWNYDFSCKVKNVIILVQVRTCMYINTYNNAPGLKAFSAHINVIQK